MDTSSVTTPAPAGPQDLDAVFEGGGARGLAFIGAIKVLEERGYRFRRVLGTSAGSIVAALLAAGYDTNRLMQLALERLPDGRSRFATFLEAPRLSDFTDDEIDRSDTAYLMNTLAWPLRASLRRGISRSVVKMLLRLSLYRRAFAFVERGGIIRSESVRAWIVDALNRAGPGYGTMTLGALFKATQKELTIIAADIDGARTLVLNHKTASDLLVASAVLMSASIPLIFPWVVWKRAGRYWIPLNEADGDHGNDLISLRGHRIVDGGLLANFPLATLVSRDPMHIGYLDPLPRANIVALHLDPGLKVPRSVPDRETRIEDWLMKFKVPGLIGRIGSAAINGHTQALLNAYENWVCRIPVKGIGIGSFDMTTERIETLIAGGEWAMRKHLAEQEGRLAELRQMGDPIDPLAAVRGASWGLAWRYAIAQAKQRGETFDFSQLAGLARDRQLDALYLDLSPADRALYDTYFRTHG